MKKHDLFDTLLVLGSVGLGGEILARRWWLGQVPSQLPTRSVYMLLALIAYVAVRQMRDLVRRKGS